MVQANSKKEGMMAVQKLDTVSPATRLLDKRRKMYENQEAYISKKKQFTQAEFEFQAREHELREADHALQQQLIQYATFLDNNAKVMRNCDQSIAKLQEENKEKDKEIERKKRQYEILLQKKSRIEKQKAAVEQYQSFLEEVRSQNSEYNEISDITERYSTLKSSQRTLIAKLQNINNELEAKKNEVANYERTTRQNLLYLTTIIDRFNEEHEQLEIQKSQLKTDEEESSAKKWLQISELSRVIMAIDNLDKICSSKRDDKQTYLNYNTSLSFQNPVPANFDSFLDREVYALSQLKTIERYLTDFQTIIEGFTANRAAQGRSIRAKTLDDEEEDD